MIASREHLPQLSSTRCSIILPYTETIIYRLHACRSTHLHFYIETSHIHVMMSHMYVPCSALNHMFLNAIHDPLHTFLVSLFINNNKQNIFPFKCYVLIVHFIHFSVFPLNVLYTSYLKLYNIHFTYFSLL